MNDMINDSLDLYRLFQENQEFKKWLAGVTFGLTYRRNGNGQFAPQP